MIYKMLLAEENTVFRKKLAFAIEDTLKDVRLHTVDSFAILEKMLTIDNYQMVVLCLPVSEQWAVKALLDIVKLYPSLAIFILIEDMGIVKVQKLYREGVKGILDKHSNTSEILNAIKQIRDGGIYLNKNTWKRLVSMG